MTRLYDAHLQAVGLTLTQYSLLSNLTRCSPIGLHALAEVMGMERTTLTRTLAPLRERGLIEETTGDDRRVKIVRLTAPGREIHVAAQSLWQAAQDELRGRLGGDALVQFHGLLDKVFELLG